MKSELRQDRVMRALLQLIDDPDTEVYQTVSERILDYGKAIIPNLEELWEVTEDISVQSRIEILIHRVHFQDLEADFHEWSSGPNPELLRGAILVAKLQYPDLSATNIFTQIDAMRRNLWLELNPYLTPLEQVNVFNSMLYSYYRLQGHELSVREPKYFFINQMLENRQGNSYTIGIVYLILCELLDVPVFAVDVPRQLVFAYIDATNPFLYPERDLDPQTSFFIDPMNGAIYTRSDVDNYLHKIGARDAKAYLAPLDNKRVIFKMMEELALSYRYRREEEKADEVQQLMRIISGVESR